MEESQRRVVGVFPVSATRASRPPAAARAIRALGSRVRDLPASEVAETGKTPSTFGRLAFIV